MNGVIDFLISARSATIREKHSPRSGRSSSPQCKHGTPDRMRGIIEQACSAWLRELICSWEDWQDHTRPRQVAENRNDWPILSMSGGSLRFILLT
jgi:hypothetical protein